MGYSAEVVLRARARLAQAKEDRESENRQHLALAYAQVPRLREIDRQLRMTMAHAARAAFQAGTDGQQELSRARQENQALQREREELCLAHFEEGFLDDSPICDKCGGSGYIGSTMCECLRELCRQEQKKEVSILSGSRDSFGSFRLDYYPDRIDPNYGVSPRTIMEKNLRDCKTYAVFFSEKSENLLLSGNPGLGKTFLSACIARTVADRGYSVAYETAGHLFTKMERAKFGGDEECRRECENFTRCDLLILDDLGTEMPGQFTNVALYSLINDRLLAGKPTIISTNLTTEDIGKRYTPQIASRLRGSYRRVPFVGDDIRMLKNGGIL